LPTLTHCFPRNFTFCVSLSIHSIARAREPGEDQFMGHNKARDNARKRAKRRKKHEQLASAKQLSRDVTARQGKNAGK
jgi:hypothetical protein